MSIMSGNVVAKIAYLGSRLSAEEGHLLHLRFKFGYPKQEEPGFEIAVMVETDVRSWRELDIDRDEVTARYVIANCKIYEDQPVTLLVKHIESTRFKVETRIELEEPFEFDGRSFPVIEAKCQGKYDSVRIDESSEYSPYRDSPGDLNDVIETSDFLMKQPMHLFGGAVGYSVKVRKSKRKT